MYNFYILPLNGSGFDSYVVLKNIPPWKAVVNLIKNGPGIVSLKKFNGYIDQNKKILQYVTFRCRNVHINNSLKRRGKSFILQKCLFKQERNQEEIYEDTWEDKKHERLPFFKIVVSSTAFRFARFSKRMEEITGYGMKNSLILPSLPIYYFNSLRGEND